MLSLFAACGDPNGPLKIKGQQFDVQSVFSARTANGSAHGLALFLGNQPDLCNAWRTGAYPAAESLVQVNFYRAEGGTSVDVDPGTYGVFNSGAGDQATAQITGGGRFVVAQAAAYTSACKTGTDLGSGLKGHVTFTGGDPISGSYELHFANGALAGEFDAPLCELTAAQFCPHQ